MKEIKYNVGDAVFLKNDSKSRAPFSKFQDRWIGLFRVTKVISEVNYEIKLIHGPSRMQVVHVDRLKPAKFTDEPPYLNNYDEPSNIDNVITESGADQLSSDDESEEEFAVVMKNQTRQREAEDRRNCEPNRYNLRSRGPVTPQDLPVRTRRPNTVNFLTTIVIVVLMFLYM